MLTQSPIFRWFMAMIVAMWLPLCCCTLQAGCAEAVDGSEECCGVSGEHGCDGDEGVDAHLDDAARCNDAPAAPSAPVKDHCCACAKVGLPKGSDEIKGSGASEAPIILMDLDWEFGNQGTMVARAAAVGSNGVGDRSERTLLGLSCALVV